MILKEEKKIKHDYEPLKDKINKILVKTNFSYELLINLV